MLLLVYWALNLPVLGQEIALLARQYPTLRNVTLRLLNPWGPLKSRTDTLCICSSVAYFLFPPRRISPLELPLHRVSRSS